MIILLGFLLLSLLLGYAFLSAVLPHENQRLKLALSPAFGLGLSSCIFSVSLFVIGEATLLTGLVECLLLLGLVAVSRRRSIGQLIAVEEEKTLDLDWTKWTVGLAVALAVLISISLIGYVYQNIAFPNGSSDAVSIWNGRALSVFTSGQSWPKSLANDCAFHPDYPLLIPGAVARLWTALGDANPYVPGVIAGIFYFSLLATVFVGMRQLRGLEVGLIFTVFMLASTEVTYVSARQLADVPLAFYWLSTLLFFALQDKNLNTERYSMLAGVSAGLGGWTKNEGVLFLVAVVVVRALVVWRARGREIFLKQGGSFFLGALPFVLLLITFKIVYAPSNDLVAGQSAQVLEQLTDVSRHSLIFSELGDTLLYFSNEKISFPGFLLAYLLAVGISKNLNKVSFFSVVGTITLVSAGYWYVYLTTPWSLAWHLRTSLSRLLVQLWPCILFAFVLLIQSRSEMTTEAMAREDESKSG